MRKGVIVTSLVLLIVAAAGIGVSAYYWFGMEHVTYEKQDPKTGLRFVASCQYSESSFRSYVTVRSASGRLISRNEIPFSADELSDCTRQQYYVVSDLVPDPSFSKLSVRFIDTTRPAVELPLFLDGLDLPNSPRPQLQRSAR